MTSDSRGAMQVKTLATDGIERWDRFVESNSNGTFFHRAGWKEVVEQSFGHKCYFLYGEENGEIRGVLPLVHVKSRLFGSSLISTGFTVGGGSLADRPETLDTLDRRALLLADEVGADVIEYRGGIRPRSGWIDKTELYVNFCKRIDADSERNMSVIPRKQRAMVRKAIKGGLVSETDRTADRLYEIYAESVRNLGTPVFARTFFDNLLRVFHKSLDIVTCLDRGRPVASVMNFYFRDTVLPYFGGGTRQAREYAGNDFMYWEVMRRACERGFRRYDFGRSKRGTGAYSFKKNWGFEPEPLTYQFWLRRGDQVPDINPLNPKYRLMIAMWKRLPLPIAKLVGPPIARCLG